MAVELVSVLIKSDPLALKLKEMEHPMELYLFVKYTIQQYLPQIKALSEEELHQLISILSIPILRNGSRFVNLKATLIDNPSTSTSALWSATSLCEELKQEILMLDGYGENYFKSVKLLENLISCLRETQTRVTLLHTKSMD